MSGHSLVRLLATDPLSDHFPTFFFQGAQKRFERFELVLSIFETSYWKILIDSFEQKMLQGVGLFDAQVGPSKSQRHSDQ